MERDKGPAKVQSRSCGIPPDRFHLIRNVGIQGAPDGLREDRDLLDGLVLVWVHAPILDRLPFYNKAVLLKLMGSPYCDSSARLD